MTPPPPLRAAVIGAGALGRHHARILASLPGVTLAAVVDRDRGRADEVARATGATALETLAGLPDRLDAVVVAVPTEAHAAVAIPLLERGVAVLVEKPLARTLAEADAMVDAASRVDAVLATGHTERFNPAVAAALGLVSKPGFVEVHRLGTFPDRSLDIDVVFDLMIHDLDLLLAAVGEEVVGIEAVGVPVLTGRVDIANARLKFSSGCIANLTASRISRDRVRKLRFFQPHSYVSIDCAAQEAEAYRLVARPGSRPEIAGGPLEVEKGEPLMFELVDFVRAVREHGRPRVSGSDGRRALALAHEITERIAQA